ncbi:MAG: hypothetical protein GY856_02900 [bacterium]|nr:hypothetical protein [bacterium]
MDTQRGYIYEMARQIIDDMEEVARWEALYYPPTDEGEFFLIQNGLLELIEGIPRRVSAVSIKFLQDAVKALISNLSPTVMSERAAQVINKLIDGGPAMAATSSTREAAKRAIDKLPERAVHASFKTVIKYLIDREPHDPMSDLAEDTLNEIMDSLPEEVMSSSTKETLRNVRFYFDGMHNMVIPDLAKVRSTIEPYLEDGNAAPLTPETRAYICEISADLKGKYSSSIMGAAANLIAHGSWNGTEIEPILFPEKAEEFKRNDQLVETLREVIASIKRIPEEIPLGELIAQWKEGRRVDRYALSHLYAFLGDLGKLMKESSRRALYSGDYHQVQQRESMLSTRVNELNTLHGITWGITPQGANENVEDCYPLMIRKTLELAAIVDVEILRKLIGGRYVKEILDIVSLEAERKKAQDQGGAAAGEAAGSAGRGGALRERIPEELRSLIPLLSEEDLETFLELLLGSVLKRASFALKKEKKEHVEEEAALIAVQPTQQPAAPAPVKVVEPSPKPLEAPIPPSEPPPAPEPTVESAVPVDERLEALRKLQGFLREFLSRSNPYRKSFDLIHRLLNQRKIIPLAMLHSMLPYLDDLMNILVPQLSLVSSHGDLPPTIQTDLMQCCEALSSRQLTPQQLKAEVPGHMDRVLEILDNLHVTASDLIEKYSAGGAVSP